MEQSCDAINVEVIVGEGGWEAFVGCTLDVSDIPIVDGPELGLLSLLELGLDVEED